jgi:tRNA-uridine 2-sulfurtransferase
MKETRRIAVAMSGGVDSSAAAALLVEQGEDVFGIMLRLWSSPNRTNRCCSPSDMAAARSIAADLDIPFYAVDAQQPFKETVVDFFLDGYAQGNTPNPCIECNRTIRWEFLLNHALSLGATHLATGHYVRIGEKDGRYSILRGVDPAKDQSYVLSVLGQEQLQHAVFPLGKYTKTEVREHARRLKLHVAERSDSQDLCFVGGGDYRDFISENRIERPEPGEIVDTDGNIIGQHQGLDRYTIGQRKGIGISQAKPLYVLKKLITSNQLVVGTKSSLGRSRFVVNQVNWVSGTAPDNSLEAQVHTRYKSKETSATIKIMANQRAQVELHTAVNDITPGQSAVFYQGEVCLGGGIIQP